MLLVLRLGFKAERFAADSLRGDRQIVLAAVSQDGASIHFSCKLFVWDGVRQSWSVALLTHFFSSTIDNPFFFVEDGNALRYTCLSLRADAQAGTPWMDCALTSQVNDCALGKHCSGHANVAWCVYSVQVVLAAASNCGMSIQHAAPHLRRVTSLDIWKAQLEMSGSFETPCFFSGLRLSFVKLFQFVSLLHLEFLQDTVIGATAMMEDQRALGFIPQDVNGAHVLGRRLKVLCNLEKALPTLCLDSNNYCPDFQKCLHCCESMKKWPQHYSTPFRKWICSPWSLKPPELSNLQELWSECFEEAQRISSRQLLNSSELERSTLSSEAALAGA